MKYQPNSIDLAWAQRMIALIKDGGILAYPSTRVIYKLDRSNRRLVLQNPEQLRERDSKEIHEQTKDVFSVLGWKVE